MNQGRRKGGSDGPRLSNNFILSWFPYIGTARPSSNITVTDAYWNTIQYLIVVLLTCITYKLECPLNRKSEQYKKKMNLQLGFFIQG